MTDDLVKRLRDSFYTPSLKSHTEAADRIEKLEAALLEIAEDCELETGLVQGTQVCAMIARKALEGKNER
jgi:hypothetical protein